MIGSFFIKKDIRYKRYIDDVFLIWEHGEEALKEFIAYLNSSHPTIKFTADYSFETINFLDVTISKDGDHLSTDLYIKPTDTHQYLHATSAHPSHVKRAIPYGQALRLNRICSDDLSFDRNCDNLEAWLIRQGYSAKMIRHEIIKARKFRRNDLLDKAKHQRKSPDLVLSLTYHPALSRLKNILSKIHLLLTPNKSHENVFPNVPVVAFKRGRSLKDILVRAKLPSINSNSGGSGLCNSKRCQVCKFVVDTGEFVSQTNKKTFKIKSASLNCNSSNVVYLFTCKTCGKQYVGSTTTKFRTRFNNYKQAEKYFNSGNVDKIQQVSFHEHFHQDNHGGVSDWSVTLIDQAENKASIRRKESFWQHTLDTYSQRPQY